MAPVQVSTIINEILDTFDYSLDIYRNSRRGHARRNPIFATTTDEQSMMILRMQPKDIKRKYEDGLAKHGRAFQAGDSMAQIRLAQVLMGFQTGLIQLFDLALSNDPKQRSQARKRIMTLSTAAVDDTVAVLTELNARLTAASALEALMPTPKLKQASMSRPTICHRTVSEHAASSIQLAAKKPSPSSKLDKRGGFVRSRSNPSLITIVPAAKANKSTAKSASSSRSQSVVPKPQDTASQASSSTAFLGQIKSNPPVLPRNRKDQLVQKAAGKIRHAKSHLPPSPAPHNNVSHVMQPTSVDDISHAMPTYARAATDGNANVQRHPSMYIVTSDCLNNLASYSCESEHAIPRVEQPPPRPHKPAHLRARADDTIRAGIRPRPPSMMTVMTASTRLGELPTHKRPDHVLTQKEIEARPIPYVLPPLLEPVRERRRFKFWGRKERMVTSVGA